MSEDARTGTRRPKPLGGEGPSAGVRPSRRRGLFLLGAVVIAILVLVVGVVTRAPWSPLPIPAWPPAGWIFVSCDVGQGDALVLADGPGTAIVVDTGPDPAKADACLSDLGVHRIPLVVLTHFHADHIDGLPAVLHGRTVGEIETTTVDDPPEGAAKVRAWASAAGVQVSRATAGEHRAYGPVSWDVLWPDASSPVLQPVAGSGSGSDSGSAGGPSRSTHKPRRSSHADSRTSAQGGQSQGGQSHSGQSHEGNSHSGKSRSGAEGSAPNNSSIVLHVRVTTPDGVVTLLLAGDIEPPAQQAILASHPNPADLAADVFKVPHHGSRYQDADLIRSVRPRVSIISVGAGNTYGHPSPDTLALVGSMGALVLRTDRDGEIAIAGSAGRLRAVLRH